MTEKKKRSPDREPEVACATFLACMFRLAVQNGTYTEIGGVRRRNLLDGDLIPLSRLAEVAGEFGLTAETARLDWKKLNSTPFNHPLLLILKNGNPVVLMGLHRDGAEAAAISDPLHREGEVFFVPRAELERLWD